MNFKNLIKHIMPLSFLRMIQQLKARRLLLHEGRSDLNRFYRSCVVPSCSNQVQMESVLIFYIHQIEKGFSFDTYQYGRGRGALSNLANISAKLGSIDTRWRDNAVYKDMVLALGEYYRRHVTAGQDVSYLTELFDEATNEDIVASSKN